MSGRWVTEERGELLHYVPAGTEPIVASTGEPFAQIASSAGRSLCSKIRPGQTVRVVRRGQACARCKPLAIARAIPFKPAPIDWEAAARKLAAEYLRPTSSAPILRLAHEIDQEPVE